jgi:hypothetical protein
MSMATYSLNLSRCALIGVLVCLWAGLSFLVLTATDSYSLLLPWESPFRWNYIYPFWCELFFSVAWLPGAFLAMMALTFGTPAIIAIQQKAWRKLGPIMLCLLVILVYATTTHFDWQHPEHRDWLRFLYCLSALGLTPITAPLLMSLYRARVDKVLCSAAYLGLIFYCPLIMIITVLGSSGNMC